MSQDVRNHRYQHAHENQYRPSNYQPAPTPVSNLVPNSFISKIRKDCECIPECSTALAPPAQVLLAQAPPTNAPLTQALPVEEVFPAPVPLAQVSLVQVLMILAAPVQATLLVPLAPLPLDELGRGKPGKLPEQVDIFDAFTDAGTDAKISEYPASRQEKIAGPLGKNVFMVVTLEEFITSDKVVTPEDVPSSAQSFSSCFLDETKIPGTDKAYDENRLKASDYTIKVISTYHLHYKEIPEMTESTHKPFLFQPPSEQISLSGASSDAIIKVIKPLHDVSEASTNHFAAYHPHYKEKLGITSTESAKPFLVRPPPKLLSLPGASSDCIVKFATYHPHYKDKLVGNPSRIFVCAANCLYFLYDWKNLSAAFFLGHDSGAWIAKPGIITKKVEPPRTSLNLLSHLFQSPSLFFSLTPSEMRPAMFECLTMPRCTPMSECEVFPNLSHTAPTVEFLPDDISLLDKRLQWQINNKSQGIRHVKLG